MSRLQKQVKLYPKCCRYVHFGGEGIIFAFIQFPKESMSQKRSTIINQKKGLDFVPQIGSGSHP